MANKIFYTVFTLTSVMQNVRPSCLDRKRHRHLEFTSNFGNNEDILAISGNQITTNDDCDLSATAIMCFKNFALQTI